MDPEAVTYSPDEGEVWRYNGVDANYARRIRSFEEQSPHSAKHHASNLPLDTLSRLHYASVGTDEDALADAPHASDELGIPSPHYQAQLLRVQPYALRRLGQHLHLLKHRLAVPVFHAQPQTPTRSVFLCDRLGLFQYARFLLLRRHGAGLG